MGHSYSSDPHSRITVNVSYGRGVAYVYIMSLYLLLLFLPLFLPICFFVGFLPLGRRRLHGTSFDGVGQKALGVAGVPDELADVVLKHVEVDPVLVVQRPHHVLGHLGEELLVEVSGLGRGGVLLVEGNLVEKVALAQDEVCVPGSKRICYDRSKSVKIVN